ncbi:MAG: ferrous iron transport protein A [Firmicutes bacterium]|nr:ferrous iron transport protein A [Bacillota bacterium]HOB34219.1 ferrous iron transport protein A [Bacillota bacterium]HPZ90213.1 ferrous iron transport protein A [Bacillota bacterium]HQE01603.1 ferrous iron transport protein A [Bacillota bacterium]
MTLADVKQGQKIVIRHIADPLVRVQAIRFGIAEGAEVTCSSVIASGPITVKKNMQEIAVGRGLAKKIRVSPVEDKI